MQQEQFWLILEKEKKYSRLQQRAATVKAGLNKYHYLGTTEGKASFFEIRLVVLDMFVTNLVIRIGLVLTLILLCFTDFTLAVRFYLLQGQKRCFTQDLPTGRKVSLILQYTYLCIEK